MKSRNSKSSQLWFVSKKYGWGWTPCTWQGWVAVLVYVAVNAIYSIVISNAIVHDEDVALALFPFILVSTVILIILCYKKGEPPRWRWGK